MLWVAWYNELNIFSCFLSDLLSYLFYFFYFRSSSASCTFACCSFLFTLTILCKSSFEKLFIDGLISYETWLRCGMSSLRVGNYLLRNSFIFTNSFFICTIWLNFCFGCSGCINLLGNCKFNYLFGLLFILVLIFFRLFNYRPLFSVVEPNLHYFHRFFFIF